MASFDVEPMRRVGALFNVAEQERFGESAQALGANQREQFKTWRT
jgi:hypothetical protein